MFERAEFKVHWWEVLLYKMPCVAFKEGRLQLQREKVRGWLSTYINEVVQLAADDFELIMSTKDVEMCDRLGLLQVKGSFHEEPETFFLITVLDNVLVHVVLSSSNDKLIHWRERVLKIKKIKAPLCVSKQNANDDVRVNSFNQAKEKSKQLIQSKNAKMKWIFN